MSKCLDCKLEMLEAKSCSYKFFKDNHGNKYPRIKYGRENWNGKDWTPKANQRCHDCGTLPEGYHHFGCDWEECPKCGGQLISCNCSDQETWNVC